ncbi:DUF5641 domain-containing protein [Trichonephila clavipes]|nr:DUF5641 domain-containing protein [Trichonephila clavipes]
MSEGCFNLRIFESNGASKSVDKHSDETFILGIIWELDNDVLKFCTSFDSLTCEVKITKRLVLSTVTKSFRSHWNVGAVYIAPKITIAGNMENEKAWNQELPQNIVNKFMKWFNEIQILKDVTVPRCMKIDIFTELHVFVDASKGSYAGCVFARSIVDSRVSVILVRAKSRVAPLKLLSIPRLKLMACCVGARLVNSILKALNMPDLKVTVWSDSTTAIWWIKEYGNWSVFVANRVKEIRQLTQIQSWNEIIVTSGPSPLPPDRVTDCAIFEVVGIDLAGPLFLKTGEKELIPLTPAMFLIENRCSDTTDIDELNSRGLRKRMKYRIKLLSDLRQRFRKEYLINIKSSSPTHNDDDKEDSSKDTKSWKAPLRFLGNFVDSRIRRRLWGSSSRTKSADNILEEKKNNSHHSDCENKNCNGFETAEDEYSSSDSSSESDDDDEVEEIEQWKPKSASKCTWKAPVARKISNNQKAQIDPAILAEIEDFERMAAQYIKQHT